MMDEKETMADRVDPREGELMDEEISPALLRKHPELVEPAIERGRVV
jgi:hypothetical protein